MRPVRALPVPDGLVGMRVDAAVARLTGISRTIAADLATAGDITINGQPAGKSDKLQMGQFLEVTLPDEDRGPVIVEEPVDGMDILYADEDVIAVHKPVGVAAHPTVGWEGPTVVGGLAAAGFRISTSGPPERKGIVQRLDVGTSGIMVVAASERAYTVLKRAFRDRTVDKVYHAIVQGHPDPISGTIDAPIGRHPSAAWRFAVMDSGKPAVTHYDTLEAFVPATLVKVHLETGRTHQIRVHFSALHHPCVGDPMYGCDPRLAERLGLVRQWLHATQLTFTHPNGQTMTLDCPYPDDLAGALEILRAENN